MHVYLSVLPDNVLFTETKKNIAGGYKVREFGLSLFA
jgi:hypothetical protein